MDKDEDDEDCGLGRDREFSESPQPSPTALRHLDLSTDDAEDSQMLINVSTLSAPEVSLVPSPEVTKVIQLEIGLACI